MLCLSSSKYEYIGQQEDGLFIFKRVNPVERDAVEFVLTNKAMYKDEDLRRSRLFESAYTA